MAQSKKPYSDFDLTKLSVEEAKRKLEGLGFPTDGWVSNEDSVPKDGPPKEKQIPTFKVFASHLEQIRDIVQAQVDKDIQQIDDLRIQVHKMREGGGS